MSKEKRVTQKSYVHVWSRFASSSAAAGLTHGDNSNLTYGIFVVYIVYKYTSIFEKKVGDGGLRRRNQARKAKLAFIAFIPGLSLHSSTTRASLSRATYIPALLRNSSFTASFGKHLYVKTQTCLSLVRSVRLPLLRPNRPRSRRLCPRRRSPRLRYAQDFVRTCYDYSGLVVTS
jgi:hypothetical protein